MCLVVLLNSALTFAPQVSCLQRDSRDNEISNVDAWSRANNLTLNQAKSVEIISATAGSDLASTRRRHCRVLRV